MRKEYLSPKTEIIKVDAILMQNASMQTKGNYGTGTGIRLGARQSNDWDDEE